MDQRGRDLRRTRRTGDLFAWGNTREQGGKPVKGRYKVTSTLLPSISASSGRSKSRLGRPRGRLFRYFQLDHLHTSRRKERRHAVRRNRIILVVLVILAVLYTLIQLNQH